MDESALDAFPVCQLQDPYVSTEFVNLVLDVGVELLGIPLFKEVDDASR